MKPLLSKHRFRNIVAIEHESFDGGNRGASGWISADVNFPDGSDTTLCFPCVDLRFYQILGMIMCQWSVFEFIMDQMTEILLEVTGDSEPNWRKTLSYKQRLSLHQKTFNSVFRQNDRIKRFHKEALSLVTEPKKVRDSIAHNLPVQGIKDGKPTIVFIESAMRLPREKHFTIDALDSIRVEITHASGYLERLAKVGDHLWPLSSHEISALRRVFDPDRWSQAKSRALKIPPQPSSR